MNITAPIAAPKEIELSTAHDWLKIDFIWLVNIDDDYMYFTDEFGQTYFCNYN